MCAREEIEHKQTRQNLQKNMLSLLSIYKSSLSFRAYKLVKRQKKVSKRVTSVIISNFAAQKCAPSLLQGTTCHL